MIASYGIKMCVLCLGRIMSLARTRSQGKRIKYFVLQLLYLYSGSWIFSVQFYFYCTNFLCVLSPFLLVCRIQATLFFALNTIFALNTWEHSNKERNHAIHNSQGNCFRCRCRCECVFCVFQGESFAYAMIACISISHGSAKTTHLCPAFRPKIFQCAADLRFRRFYFHVNFSQFFLHCRSKNPALEHTNTKVTLAVALRRT